MNEFEEIGRRLDRELKRLAEYLENEVRPKAQAKTITALRKASQRLEQAAAELEARASRANAREK